jgi:hypothetical protein
MSNINVNSENDNLILFFHEQSKACQKLKEFIPKDKKIQFIDISRVNNIPPSIKSVPTLVINNKETLSGKQVFDYFNKTDEIEFLNFSKKNSGFAFSSLDNNVENIDSNSIFSSIDMPSISDGVPKWEDNDSKESLDIDKLQAERDSMFKAVQKQ